MEGKLSGILQAKGHDVQRIAPEVTIREASRTLDAVGVGALLVMDQDRIVGILSERDIVRRVVAKNRDPDQTRVREVMTREVIALGPEVAIDEAMAVVTARRCRHLPVIDGDRLIGIISSGDLTRWATIDRDIQIGELVNFITGKYPT